MKIPYLIFLTGAAVSLCLSSCKDEVSSAIDSVCRDYFPDGEPGAAVLVMSGDRIIFDKGYGISDIDTKEAVSGETMFNVASISKQFTSVAILQLAAEGLISLEDSLSKFFPEYTDPLWNKVKIKHLLSHSSGIPDARGGMPRERKITADESVALEYLDTVKHLHFTPGTEYEYINPTFVLLGRLVERISGITFTDYVKGHIFIPAGMEKTCYFSPDATIPDMAHGYEYADVEDMPEERTAGTDDGPKDWYEYDYGEETFFATRPDGGIYSSTHEFVKWERALKNSLEGNEGFIVPSEYLEDAMTPHTRVSGSRWSDYQNRPGTWYGYGWFIEGKDLKENCFSSEEETWIYHTGDNGGFKALVAREQSKDLMIAIFSCRADWDRYDLWKKIANLL